MNMANVSNGRPQRKQLSDQLDRLDGIIDALADGLNKAVADAAREGSREAVKEILTELLTNPDILSMIRAAVGSMVPPPAPVGLEPTHTPHEACPPAAGGIVSAVINTVTGAVKSVGKRVSATVSQAWGLVSKTVRTISQNPQLKKALVIGTGIGLATAVVASTNHTVAATLSGVGAAATAVAVQVGCWFRSARQRLGLA